MSRQREMDVSDALLIAEVLERYKDYDIEAVELEKLTPMEALIKELREEVPEVQVRKKKPKKKMVHSASCSGKCRGNCGARHWKTRQKNERDAYRDGGKATRRRRKAELLSMGGEGWWTYQRRMWWQKKVPVEMTREEFVEVVYPTFGVDGLIPIFRRYSTAKPIALDNLLVIASATASGSKDVLFDGKEYSLRAAGYIV